MAHENRAARAGLRLLRRLLLFLVMLPLSLLTIEAGYFVWVLSYDQDLRKADVIVSFEGAHDRARAAYSLVDQSYAPYLLISPSTEGKLAFYEKRFKPTKAYGHILEQKARTTFENALLTMQAVKQNGFKSVILVTSWDHMPRSYFLFRLMTFRSGIRVEPHLVATGSLSQDNWYQHRTGWKMLYNEMLQLWGSLVEIANFKIKGRLPEQVPGVSRPFSRLKQILLFEVDHGALNG
jgi:uncharacterized SAM-binding protein YcdF (DUF218 family)